jgi:hypothetical protein
LQRGESNERGGHAEIEGPAQPAARRASADIASARGGPIASLSGRRKFYLKTCLRGVFLIFFKK